MNRKLSRAAVAALAALTLAACGSGTTASSSKTSSASTSSSSPTSSSPTPSSPAASKSVAGASFDKPAPGGKVDPVAFSHATAAAVEAEKSYHMVVTSPSEKTAINGDVVRVSPTRTDMSMSTADGGIRLVDGSAYISDTTGDLPDGKKWLAITKGSKDPTAGMMLAGFNTLLATLGNQGSLSDSAFAAGTATFVGDESDGAHYRLVIPAKQVMESALKVTEEMAKQSGLPSSAQAMLQQELDKQTAGLDGKSVTYNYWLDDKLRPAKIEVDAAALGAAGGGAAKMTSVLSKWGQSVEIAAPPASETVSIDEAMNSLGGGNDILPTDLPTSPAGN